MLYGFRYLKHVFIHRKKGKFSDVRKGDNYAPGDARNITPAVVFTSTIRSIRDASRKSSGPKLLILPSNRVDSLKKGTFEKTSLSEN